MAARWGASVLLVVAAVTYSAWLVELFLPDRLSLLEAYVSEYSAVGQPYRMLFRTTDMIAAICLLSAAFLIARRVPRSWLVVTGLAVLGLSTLADANFTLDCASSVSAACREVKAEGAVSLTDHLHIVTSVLSDLGMAIAALGAVRLARRGTLPWLGFALIGVTGLAIAFLDPLGPGHFAGAILRVQLIVVGVGLVVGARWLTRIQGGNPPPEAPVERVLSTQGSQPGG
ncbi:DUF998 domain-containing protein [Actinocrispum wychmicini]|uniref:Uncharacterized protein DUF998 n=1 Tax=Actinocrispum wychmicini TaxID=1213861 RepID=A0A4R2JX53_9PSEU|nr:DUF998 domain-containing protein [Actinocrispum wychmicini]TCO58725.1 uncharacterized protein DUF998 [Actinocrispum wychmicini]